MAAEEKEGNDVPEGEDVPVAQKEEGPAAEEVFQPRIVGFLCNWCSYAAADLCGVSRYQYSKNIRIVRVMCSARVDMSLILEALLQGADGVFVGGCHLGDCHYLTGNYYTQQRIRIVKKLLDKTGIDHRRVRLEWISASEGEKFSQVVNEFTEELRELGPTPVAGDDPDMRRLEALYVAKNVADDFRLRVLTNKYIELTERGNVYGNKVETDRLDGLLESTIDDEFTRAWILYMTRYQPRSVEEMSERTGIAKKKLVEHIVTLKDRGLLSMESSEPPSPTYLSHAIVEVLTEAEQDITGVVPEDPAGGGSQ